MLNKIKSAWYNVSQGIVNLIVYAPIIWLTREYDYSYILDILKYKIRRTASYINSRKRHVGYERTVQRMKLVTILLDRIKDEYYMIEYQNYLDQDINWIPIEGDNVHVQLEMTPTRNDLDKYLAKYPHSKKEVLAGKNFNLIVSDNIGLSLAVGMVNHEKAIRIVFAILQNHIQEWWD